MLIMRTWLPLLLITAGLGVGCTSLLHEGSDLDADLRGKELLVVHSQGVNTSAPGRTRYCADGTYQTWTDRGIFVGSWSQQGSTVNVCLAGLGCESFTLTDVPGATQFERRWIGSGRTDRVRLAGATSPYCRGV